MAGADSSKFTTNLFTNYSLKILIVDPRDKWITSVDSVL